MDVIELIIKDLKENPLDWSIECSRFLVRKTLFRNGVSQTSSIRIEFVDSMGMPLHRYKIIEPDGLVLDEYDLRELMTEVDEVVLKIRTDRHINACNKIRAMFDVQEPQEDKPF